MNSSAERRARPRRDDQVEHPRLHGDVERGRRLVADQQRGVVGQRDGEHDALALAAGELVGVGPRRVGRGRAGRPGRAARPPRARRPAPSRPVAVDASDLGDLGADPHHRVQRGHRLLEHHGHVAVPRTRPSAAREAPTRSWSTPARRTEPVACAVLGQQPDERQRGQRLARAGLTDQAHPLAGADAEARRRRRARAADGDAQVTHGEHCVPPASRCGSRVAGSSAVLQPRVEAVAQAVAEQVEAEHGQGDRDARERAPGAARRRAAPGPPAASGPTTASAAGCRSRGRTAPPRRARRWRTSTDACTMTRLATLGRTCRSADRPRPPPGRAGGEDVLGAHHLHGAAAHDPREARHRRDADGDHRRERAAAETAPNMIASSSAGNASRRSLPRISSSPTSAAPSRRGCRGARRSRRRRRRRRSRRRASSARPR